MGKISNKLKIIVGIGCIIIVFIIFLFIAILSEPAHKTPLDAMEYWRDTSNTVGEYQERDLLTVKELLGIVYIENDAYVYYISGANVFTEVTCEYDNKKDSWGYKAIGYESNLDFPSRIIDTGDEVVEHAARKGNYVFGLKMADGKTPYVNDIEATVKTFDVKLNAKEYQVQFWYVENILDENYMVEVR